MRFARQFLVSAAVLTSSSMLAEEVFADDVLAEESGTPTMIGFSCWVPVVGDLRCGDEHSNVRVGPLQRLSIRLESIKQDEKKPYCVTFFVHHAVTGKEMAISKEMCTIGKAEGVWTNPNEEVVDVFMTVKGNKLEKFPVTGFYIIGGP